MNLKNNLLTLVLFLFYSLNVSASNSNDWTTYHEDDKIKIEYQKINCEYPVFFDQDFIIFKITNLTNKDIAVSWFNELWYDKKCINCSEKKTDETLMEIHINSNETVIGNCYDQNALRIFSKFSEKSENMPGIDKIVELTKFKLKNIITVYE